MYPSWTEEEIWEICLTLLEKDSPIPGLISILSEFRNEFHKVYENIRDEHAHIKGKYYRSGNGIPIVNPLNTAHYARLIYYFSNSLYSKKADRIILDQLFLSIKSRCCIDLFYEFELKKFFLPAHAFATVMGRAQYDDYLVVCQNCTIGNNKGIYPHIGKHVILRPGSMVLGDCKIGNNVEISAGSVIIDEDIPHNSRVFGRTPNLIIKEINDICTDIFFD